MNIPEGFARIAPYIFAKDADKYMEFLVKALGGVEVDRSLMPDGKVANGQVKFGDGDTAATVMVSEATRGFAPSQASLYFYVEDADAAMKQAIDHGAEKILDVMDMDYGDRQGGIKDPAGNIWWISQRLTDKPYH